MAETKEVLGKGVPAKAETKAVKKDDWKDRFKVEYNELKDRLEKLQAMITKYRRGELDFTPNCPLGLLVEQASCMEKYLQCLKNRVVIEKIEL